jgi:hypothetical protein
LLQKKKKECLKSSGNKALYNKIRNRGKLAVKFLGMSTLVGEVSIAKETSDQEQNPLKLTDLRS